MKVVDNGPRAPIFMIDVTFLLFWFCWANLKLYSRSWHGVMF